MYHFIYFQIYINEFIINMYIFTSKMVGVLQFSSIGYLEK